ncbi:MAG: hypothetical protein WAN23_03240 [Candidatus Acidiferrales bacterium]
MSVLEVGKRLVRFAGKAFAFGFGIAVAAAVIGGSVYWYYNRLIDPTVYPELPITNIGIKYKFTTKWQDGNTYYKFSVLPLSDNLEKQFDSAARSDAAKSFVIHLGDSGQFDIPDCALSITNLIPVVGDDGLVQSMDAQGSLSSCSRSEYKDIRSFYPTYVFPDVAHTAKTSDIVPPDVTVTKPKSHNDTPTGIEANVTCDVIVYDRDRYALGDPVAIGTLNKGDTVRYVGHVTLSGEDIVEFHGRRGYVDSCLDVD